LYIQRVRIQNVRGFKEVDLDLTRPTGSPAGWTVLAGRNGSGKSTLLKAMALAAAGYRQSYTIGGFFKEWIRKGQTEAEAEIFSVLSQRGLSSSALRWLELPGSRPPGIAQLMGMPEHFHQVGPLDESQHSKNRWQSVTERLFLVAYGPYRRLSGHATDAQRLMEGSGPVARMINLFREDASLVECVTWLREIYLRRLEKKPGAAELEQAVIALLNDGLLPGQVRVESIDSEALWVLQHGVRLPLQELSDGYRTTAALVMDIVRHLYLTFGKLRIETATDAEGTFQRVLHEGVVLIDEVETHLHVSWQKKIGFWLKRHFPHIQFIVTTHSPFVCQAADPGGLIRLPAPGEDRPVEHVPESLYYTVVNGGADDAVLTELFGLDTPYSDESEKLREEIARLEARVQQGKATEGDRQSLDEMRSRLPRTLTTDVEQALRKLTADL
jgi:predicted ATP-binding protein involved in virulence